MGTLYADVCTFTIISRWGFLRRRIISRRSCREIRTHIWCSI